MNKEQIIEPKIHSGHIELAVVALLNYRVYTIVPNISHGLLGRHEADLLCYHNGKFTEVEIKISASDLKADFKKQHGHQHKYITRLIYAMPHKLCEKYADIIPKQHGIISVTWHQYRGCYLASWYRQARHSSKVVIPQSFIEKFMSLGCMRIWTLKHRLSLHKKNLV